MSKVHIVSLIENYSSYGFGEAGKLYKSSPSIGAEGVEFTGLGPAYTRYVLNYWDTNCVGRDVQGGPVSQSSHAELSAQASVIAAHHIEKPPLLTIADGDYIVDPALDLILKVHGPSGPHHRYPSVEIVTEQPATVDYSELVASENAKPQRYVSESYLSG